MDRYFWAAPATDEIDLRSLGTDGLTTLIEGVRQGRYHAVQRWCLQCLDHKLSAADAGLRECLRRLREAVP